MALPHSLWGRNSDLILGLVIADFPAVGAVILPVGGEANRVLPMAEGAILNASAFAFGLVTNEATKFLVGHHKTYLSGRNGHAG